MPYQLLLTFDVEDCINEDSNEALYFILNSLEKNRLRALFFLTGHAAEKLKLSPKILRLLREHEIGFHSSAHSVRPTIFEYCDVERYEDAYLTSLERETSHINPVSGKIEGIGGIHTVRDLFPEKEILAYRAPGFCCPPPHLEAMMSLGFKYDFSWGLSKIPVFFKGITFYPQPVFLDCEAAFLTGGFWNVGWVWLLKSIMTTGVAVLNFHPHDFVNMDYWDSIYHKCNPSELDRVDPRRVEQQKTMFMKFERLIKMICAMRKSHVIDAEPNLIVSTKNLDVNRIDVRKIAQVQALWPRTFFAYELKYINSQISRFFSCSSQ